MSKTVSARNLKKLAKLGGVPKSEFDALKLTCEQTQYVIYTLAGFEAALVVGKGIKKLVNKKKKASVQEQLDEIYEELSGFAEAISKLDETSDPHIRELAREVVDSGNEDILDKVSELLERSGLSTDVSIDEIEKEIGRIMLEIQEIKNGQVPAKDISGLISRVEALEQTITAFAGEVENMRGEYANLQRTLQAQAVVNQMSQPVPEAEPTKKRTTQKQTAGK